jgi:hypothetical protein
MTKRSHPADTSPAVPPPSSPSRPRSDDVSDGGSLAPSECGRIRLLKASGGFVQRWRESRARYSPRKCQISPPFHDNDNSTNKCYVASHPRDSCIGRQRLDRLLTPDEGGSRSQASGGQAGVKPLLGENQSPSRRLRLHEAPGHALWSIGSRRRRGSNLETYELSGGLRRLRRGSLRRAIG